MVLVSPCVSTILLISVAPILGNVFHICLLSIHQVVDNFVYNEVGEAASKRLLEHSQRAQRAPLLQSYPHGWGKVIQLYTMERDEGDRQLGWLEGENYKESL